jgi:hypothetical protein
LNKVHSSREKVELGESSSPKKVLSFFKFWFIFSFPSVVFWYKQLKPRFTKIQQKHKYT